MFRVYSWYLIIDLNKLDLGNLRPHVFHPCSRSSEPTHSNHFFGGKFSNGKGYDFASSSKLWGSRTKLQYFQFHQTTSIHFPVYTFNKRVFLAYLRRHPTISQSFKGITQITGTTPRPTIENFKATSILSQWEWWSPPAWSISTTASCSRCHTACWDVT